MGELDTGFDPRSTKIYEHTKEIRVRNAIAAHAIINPDFEGFIHDKPIYTAGCDCTHRRRVDHRKSFDATMFALDTDEHGHRGYDAHDEEIRYDDLYMVHSGKWVFIRFNPDGGGVDLEDKLVKLIEVMEECIGRIKAGNNTELMEITYLYYK